MIFLERMALSALLVLHNFILKKAVLLNLTLSVQTNMNYFASSSVFAAIHK